MINQQSEIDITDTNINAEEEPVLDIGVNLFHEQTNFNSPSKSYMNMS